MLFRGACVALSLQSSIAILVFRPAVCKAAFASGIFGGERRAASDCV